MPALGCGLEGNISNLYLIPYLKKKSIFCVSPDILHLLLMNLDVVTRVFKVLFISFQSIKKIEKRLITFVRNLILVREFEKFRSKCEHGGEGR